MTTSLPVRSPSGRAVVEAPYTRRAGMMVGLALFLFMALSSWGLGWAAMLSALVPIMVGAGASGVTEKARRWADQTDSSVPIAVGGAFLGALTGGLLAPLWGFCSAVLGLGGALALPAAAPGHLFFAGAALGGVVGATSGFSVGTVRKGRDPLQSGMIAGGLATAVTGIGLFTGAFPWILGVFGSWLGADPALFTRMLEYAPHFMGNFGLSLLGGVSAFAGTLTIQGAAAREKRLALPDPNSFPSWARADSVTGFHRQNPTLYID